MAREETVKKTLGLSDSDKLNERGVYRRPMTPDLVEHPSGNDPVPQNEVLLSEEWLSNRQLEEHFSIDRDLNAALPQGLCKRLDLDPRILVLEGISEPTRRVGEIKASGQDAWILDSREGPSALAVPQGDHELIFWAENGDVRLFALRHEAAPG